jgi:hypothetical protein
VGSRLVLLALLLCTGCQAVKDRASEYLSEVAVEQITRAVDRKLEDRGLNVAILRDLADTDRSGGVSAGEVTALARSTVIDLVELKAEQAGEKGRADLEQKLAALAGAKDLDELRSIAAEQGTFGKGTAMSVVGLLIAGLVNRIFSANKHAKTREELAVAKTETDQRLGRLEQLVGIDLNSDGVIGPALAARVAPPVPGPAAPAPLGGGSAPA